MKRLANGFLAVAGAMAAKVPDLVRDALGLAGAGAVAYGFYLINPPYGYIAGGVLLIVGVTFSALAPTPKG